MTLYVFPGMGADSTMYTGAWMTLPDTVFVDWPAYKGEHSLAQIADRLINNHGITATDEVAGSSLGGMIALEIAQRLSLAHVILIGSARARQEINPLLTILAPLANLAPLGLSQALSVSSAGGFGSLPIKADQEFIKAMCLAVAHWTGSDLPDDRITRLHGTLDLVIKCPDDSIQIEGAGHLVAMTHAEQCVDAISKERQRRGISRGG